MRVVNHGTRRKLNEPVLSKAHVRFTHLWFWDGNPTEIMSRAVDETGYKFSLSSGSSMQLRGGKPRYHFNPVTAWYIKKDG